MMRKSLSLFLSLLLLFSLLTGCTEEVLAPQPQLQGTTQEGEIPPYSGNPYVPVNDNVPFFLPEEITDISFEEYSPLDDLGRCGVTVASIGRDLMPTEKRGDIGMVKPTGWQVAKYDWVDGKYLYNRCHLIGYQLSGENANRENLITGTQIGRAHV